MLKWRVMGRVVISASLLAAVASPSMVFAASKQKSKTPPVTKGTLVALGDSITFGYNLGDNKAPSPKAFPYLIGKKEHLAVSDLGVPGWTSTDLLTALTTSASMQTAVKAANVVTVEIGSNDLLQPATSLLTSGSPPTPAQEQTLVGELTTAVGTIGQNMSSIVTEVEQLNPNATIVLYDIYDPIPATNSTLYPLGEQAIGAANLAIAQVALTDKVVIADAYDAYHNHPNYILPNDVHPTVKGQQVLAAQGETALQLAPILKTVDTPQGWQSITWWLGQQFVNWSQK